jgi:hypothetical protein
MSIVDPDFNVTDGKVTRPAERATGRIGRPPGAPNKANGLAKHFAREIVESPEYRASLKSRAKSGTLPPQVETMLWAYAYGKPTEKVEITTPQHQDMSEMSTEELAERAALIASVLKDTADARAAMTAVEESGLAEASAYSEAPSTETTH